MLYIIQNINLVKYMKTKGCKFLKKRVIIYINQRNTEDE